MRTSLSGLKWGLIESWLDIQHSVVDQVIDQWWLPYSMFQSQREAFWTHATMCWSTAVNNLLWNLHYICFTTFNQ